MTPSEFFHFLAGLLWQFLFPQPARRLVILMPATMNSEETVVATVKALTKKGNPTTVPTPINWIGAPAGVANLTPAGDGLSCSIAGVAPGSLSLAVNAGPLSASDTVAIAPAPAATLVLSFGTPA